MFVCTPAKLMTRPLASLEPLGADAFLPALTEELIWSPHIGETQLDVEFLMELLDPGELRGEGELPLLRCPDTEKKAGPFDEPQLPVPQKEWAFREAQ